MLKTFTQILIVATSISSFLTHECGDWVPFKDEKCFKVFDFISTETVAEVFCREKSNGSVLAIIKTFDEQKFINKYLDINDITDNVWIGIKKIKNSFKFLDGTDITYKNWANDRPLKNSIDFNCVELSVDPTNYGKWKDENCHKKNAILCQKNQPWSVERLQDILIDTKRIYNEKMEEHANVLDTLLKTTIPDLQKLIDNLRSNPVPIGFIYVQLSGQSEPKTLWPNTEWENISAKYSGLFFRTEGGESSPFGQIQEQQTQSLEIFNDVCDGNYSALNWHKITENALKRYLFTGNVESNRNYYGINLRHNNEEIRPRNQAIRIWIRIG